MENIKYNITSNFSVYCNIFVCLCVSSDTFVIRIFIFGQGALWLFLHDQLNKTDTATHPQQQ